MKFWKITAPGKIERGEHKELEVPEGFARIKVSRVGLSSTDVNIFAGTQPSAVYPIIPGRHAVGMISEVGENNLGLQRGQKVAVKSMFPCGECFNCKAGKTQDCENTQYMGINLDGLLRDFALVKTENLYELPVHIPDSLTQFTEHIALAIKTLHELGVEKGEHIAITSASILGLILAQVAMYYQAVPIIIDASEERLNLARSLGVSYAINPVLKNPLKEIIGITGGRKCEKVAHILSADYSFQAFDLSAHGGSVAVVGWRCNSNEYVLQGSFRSILEKRLRVIGVNSYDKQIPAAINLLANKSVSVEPLISREVSFDQVPSTFKEMSENIEHYIKVAVSFK
jgi:threonine dehydrogenase-like Zn-dependent dehydrogenase